MLRTTLHPPALRVITGSRLSRAVGYEASAYLVRGVLVDTGCPSAASEMRGFLDRTAVRGVAVTHWHEDHAGNLGMLLERGIPVMVATSTVDALRAAGRIPLYRRVVWGRFTPPIGEHEAFTDDALSLISTPGHTADHHVVWDSETGTVFGGDLFLGVRVKAAHHGEDPRTLVTSLRRIAALDPERLFDGHRGLVDRPAEQLRAKADWIEETVATIEGLFDRGWSDRRIRRAILGREELAGYFSGGGVSRLNLVRSVRSTGGSGAVGA